MTTQVEYTANGATAVFPFPFAIETEVECEVLLSGVRQSGDYCVRGQGSIDGGAVVFDSPPAAGLTVTLRHRGALPVTAADAQPGYLADKLVAGANITLDIVTEAGGVQRLRITGADTETVDALEKSANLSDLEDKAAARANLGVYATAEVEARDQAVRDAALLKSGNLAGLADVAAARTNLGVYSKAETDVGGQAVRDAALLKANNLSDLADKAAARANLGIASSVETNAAISTAVAALSNQVLHRDQNLGEVADKGAARGNLDVYSKAEVASAIAAAQPDMTDVLYRNVPAVVEAGFWSKPVALEVTSGVATPDPLVGTVFTLTLTAATTLGFPSGMAGKAGMFLVVATQDATGGRALTLAPGYALAGGKWSTAANAVNLLWVTSDGSGTALDVVISQRGV